MTTDQSKLLQEQVHHAYENNQPLNIVGGNSKSFYGNNITGEVLKLSDHSGIVEYEPTELVITANAGTSLSEINQLLDSKNQMLGFEPPQFSAGATLGGTIACNFSGPRRAYAGAARDFLLGCNIINGKAEMLTFGGNVMKNVAGYDVSRLMAGAMGTLGIILSCSVKTLPKPEAEMTLSLNCNENEAINTMRNWAQKSLPISATCFYGSQLFARLSGTDKAVKTAFKNIGGEAISNTDLFWQSIKEQQHEFFLTDKPLWRVSIDATASPLKNKTCLYEWSGALRWFHADENDTSLIDYAKSHDGHATLFKGHTQTENVFQALPDGLAIIHQNLKKSFDPKGILNHGKLYSGF